MEVRIWFERADPPVGFLCRFAAFNASDERGNETTQFSGWLELLRALSDALGIFEDIPPEP